MTLRPLICDRWSMWHVVGAAVLALLGILATMPAWQEIWHTVARPGNEENSQIWLVLPVAAALIWVRRMRFRHCKPSFTLLGPILALLGWAFYFYGFYRPEPENFAQFSPFARGVCWTLWKVLGWAHLNTGYMTLWYAGAILVVIGCIVSVMGKNLLFRFFPAIMVLFFLIPVSATLRRNVSIPLQGYLAEISHFLLQILWVSSSQEGNSLLINGRPVEIAEACNGMRMVFALILVVYAFAFCLPLRNSVRVLLLLASPVAAMVCNIIRILALAYLYGYGPSQNFADQFHDVAGWIMLPVAFGLLYGIIKLLKWTLIPVTRYTLAAQ